MSVVITKEQLLSFDPSLARTDIDVQALTDAINVTIKRFGIDQNIRRVRYFIAQVAFETGNFRHFVENLNYTSAARLVQVWPSRFSMDARAKNKAYAPDYVNNPEGLANLVYSNRMGNGSPASGHGYKYRGRGGFHLTGLDNYKRCSIALYGDNRLVDNPDLVNTKDFKDAIASAGWFWDTNKLNPLADRDEYTNVTKIINGSTATVPARLEYLRRANRSFF